MNIQAYISTLLYRYQCVIIPGFGAFLTEMRSSYFDKESNSFYPPSKKLSFNASITNNDGLLANYIMRVEKIGYEDALQAIRNLVNKWNKQLETEEALILDGIGTFTTNQENKITFEPVASDLLLKTAFGLTPLNAAVIDRQAPQTVEKQIVPIQRRRPVYNFFKYAATITIIAGIGSLLYNEYDNYLEAQAVQIEKNVQTQVQSKIQQATFVMEPSATTISLPVKNEIEEIVNTPYYIIASAYRSENSAQSVAQKLKEKGYTNAQALKRTKYGMYPVAYGGYATQVEAQKELRKIHQTLNTDAWILVQ
ncbi:HU domain-containing protein [Myroides pelagicus]|uniref:SPOR domain-containing protein n=1 Tax=Myroides pelagicus TaxID=270914 RepID=A0A7K1GIW5_9FLAO|nr:SPOR domain-containing protein [Myroides pelagicus]MEC4113632.1 SPOR domain-containing protein [Myroides pelagicus]MTH28831.1 SPOR domain-containing protein [Myroides pelagicus]